MEKKPKSSSGAGGIKNEQESRRRGEQEKRQKTLLITLSSQGAESGGIRNEQASPSTPLRAGEKHILLECIIVGSCLEVDSSASAPRLPRASAGFTSQTG